MVTVDHIREQLLAGNNLKVIGSGENSAILPPHTGPELHLNQYSGILELSKPDQVFTVKAGTNLKTLNQELAEHNLMLPITETHGTIGGWLASGRPHWNEHLYGPLKDWVLGMKIMLTNGEVCKCGSQVVKNVAGYDIHRWLVGSRGVYALILEVTMKAYARQELPQPPQLVKEANLIHRCLPSNIETLTQAYQELPHALSPCRTTLFAKASETFSSTRTESDWIMSPWEPLNGPRLQKAKQIFDPEAKLWSGGFA